MRTQSLTRSSAKTIPVKQLTSSERSGSSAKLPSRLLPQARCMDLTRLCPTLPRVTASSRPTGGVQVSTPSVDAPIINGGPKVATSAAVRTLARNRPQRAKTAPVKSNPGQPRKSALVQKSSTQDSAVSTERTVAFAPMSRADAEYTGAKKGLGMRPATKRSIADRAELISSSLPFQQPILVGVDKRRFEGQPVGVNEEFITDARKESRISTPEYADHALNMRMLNYLPRDKELMDLSKVAVGSLEAIGRADAVFNSASSTALQQTKALMTMHLELTKLRQALSDYLDAKTGTLNVGGEDDADRYESVAEKHDAIDNQIEAAWASIKKNEVAVRAAGFNL